MQTPTTPTSRDALIAQLQARPDWAPRYVCFWKPSPKHGQRGIGPECFSQWALSPFQIGAHTYRTAEHWMMAGKARLFGDDDRLNAILAAEHPSRVKRLGRRVTPFDDATWRAHRFDLVVEGNVAKFRQHPDMRAVLMATGDAVLVEASPLDRIWGIGATEDDPTAHDPTRWGGLNLLGFALMQARDVLAREG